MGFISKILIRSNKPGFGIMEAYFEYIFIELNLNLFNCKAGKIFEINTIDPLTQLDGVTIFNINFIIEKSL